jgi:hypothetical protein
MSRIESNFSAMRASREAGDTRVKLLVADPAQRGRKEKEIAAKIETEGNGKKEKSTNFERSPWLRMQQRVRSEFATHLVISGVSPPP